MDALTFLKSKSDVVDTALRRYFGEYSGPPTLREAMEYSLFAGGKRLRPALVLGAVELVGEDDAVGLPAACAIEMVHSYSLIHDDLPAMDDDDLRRGKPTCHKVYGEALAILAGDTMLTMAFELAARCGEVRIIEEIARAAGPRGMAGGQVMDLQSEGRALSLEQLQCIHRGKTGALIRACLRCGAMLAGATEPQLDVLTRYGEAVGLAFQIADDILDVVGTEEQLGKPIGSDEAKAKSTYPAVVGLARSRELAQEAAHEAVAALGVFGPEADVLRELAQFIVDRET